MSEVSTPVDPAYRRPCREDGYLPIGDYAAIGDQRTAALVGLDGSIDWLCLPSFESPFVLGALVAADRGGRFTLEPSGSYEAARRYLPETNVLETTFRTAEGTVRVTDAMTISDGVDDHPRELVRRIEGLEGEVPMHWRLAPRFSCTERPAHIDRSGYRFVARRDGEAVVLQAWDAGAAGVEDGAIAADFRCRAGETSLLALSAAPMAAGLPGPVGRDELEGRLESTIAWWRGWVRSCPYRGPWADAVTRSGLVLKMLVDAASGAVVAAPTTGLPEAVGGSRNWDYRYSWLRDSSFAIDALMRLGDDEAAGRFLTWLTESTRRDGSRPHPFYRLSGTPDIGEEELPVAGYRRSRPVRRGNGAVGQLQLGNYGDVLQSATLYADRGHDFDPATAERLAELADQVCELWTERDSGIWELGTHLHYTASKMQCWIALDRAQKLAAEGKIPADHVERWEETAARIQHFVEERCWSGRLGAYARSADGDELDAGILAAIFMDYEASDPARFHATVDRLRERLGDGPLLYRYTGMAAEEGTFLACAFWLVHALVRLDRLDEAETLMGELVPLANDVGLYAEEMDASSRAMLGNFPQGLTHLALVNAAVTFAEARPGD
jgi:GH15 family glucan-1,4-alpha-glucosidase